MWLRPSSKMILTERPIKHIQRNSFENYEKPHMEHVLFSVDSITVNEIICLNFTFKLEQWWFVVLRIFSMPLFKRRNIYLSVRKEIYDVSKITNLYRGMNINAIDIYREITFCFTHFIQNRDFFITLYQQQYIVSLNQSIFNLDKVNSIDSKILFWRSFERLLETMYHLYYGWKIESYIGAVPKLVWSLVGLINAIDFLKIV